MLSKEDNEFLTRVGPGTPMGNLLRQYWLPAMLDSELEADGVVRRIRLLGEDLVAFKDTKGRVGVVAENCPHRGSSLFLGRNESEGIRCAYHGWKFDVTGRCVEMPSEPAESNFKNKVRLGAYPCQERNGIVWVYMGSREVPPPLPDHPANIQAGRPNDNSFKYVRECNWVQALEGDIDTIHIGFLHSRFGSGLEDETAPTVMARRADQAGRPAHIELLDTDWGAMYAARRDLGDGRDLIRTSQFLLPFYTMPASAGGKVWIPIDDENTLVMEWSTGRNRRPVGREEDLNAVDISRSRQPYGYLPDNPLVQWGNWRLRADRSNNWLRDRSLEKDKYFLGILSNPLQDSAVQVLMGEVYDRTREHLGTTDSMIIRVRQVLMRAAKRLEQTGEVPPTVNHPELYRVKGWTCLLPNGGDWMETGKEQNWLSSDGDLPRGEFAVAGSRGGGGD